MTRLAQLLLVLTSIAPVVFVYGASVALRNRTLAILLFIVVVVFFLSCWAILSLAKRYVEHEPKQIDDVAGLEKESLAFLVAYALPVVTAAAKPITNGEWLSVALSLGAFLISMALLVWQQQLFYANPVAALLGYHFHSAKCPTGERVLVVSRKKTLTVKAPLSVAVLSDYLWLDVG